MSFNGVRLFRYALLFEMGANMGGIIPCLFAPDMALSFMVKGPSQITPAAVSMMQWFGTLFLTGFTLPLALCYPNPVPSQGGNSEIVAWRRLTCKLEYIVNSDPSLIVPQTSSSPQEKPDSAR
ncbi:hypothetical protein LTR10_007714 [Elasticomyces elasticus]|nr:hypothetical protein LTR10_007714 [Elasticomyces elasticus]KAK4970715.1 hypothetical protein LTR42_007691 [Elasticomyces elasticus]